MPQSTYADDMSEGTPFIELQICLEDPPELSLLVRTLAAVGHQFDEYLRREHRELSGAARLFVREIRKGSTIIELIPQLVMPLLASMDTVLIVDNFVRSFGGTIQAYIDGFKPQVTKSDVADFMGPVTLLANDSNGRAIISSATYHETKTTKRIEIEFDTSQAKKAIVHLEQHKHELELPAYEVFKNVLMVFWQSNKKTPKTGKPTGEKAIIERISKKALAITYESDLVRGRIKYETTEDEKNLYKKGFFVDCMVERFNGKPVAYKITQVIDVIDLPDGDDEEGEASLPSI